MLARKPYAFLNLNVIDVNHATLRIFKKHRHRIQEISDSAHVILAPRSDYTTPSWSRKSRRRRVCRLRERAVSIATPNLFGGRHQSPSP